MNESVAELMFMHKCGDCTIIDVVNSTAFPQNATNMGMAKCIESLFLDGWDNSEKKGRGGMKRRRRVGGGGASMVAAE